MDDIQKISDFIERKVRELGFELYDLEIKDAGHRIIVRVFIDRMDRFIGIQDCVFVTRGLETHLENMIQKSFVLEVSSPGADRELKTDFDFERFKGMQVEVIKKKGGSIKGKLMGKIMGEIFIREESEDEKGKEKKGRRKGSKGGKKAQSRILSLKLEEIEKVKLCP